MIDRTDKLPPMPRAAEPLLVDLGRVAELLSVSRRTAKRLAADGTLPGVRRVRRRLLVVLADLKAWIARGCPEPAVRPRRRGAGAR